MRRTQLEMEEVVPDTRRKIQLEMVEEEVPGMKTFNNGTNGWQRPGLAISVH